MKAFDLLQKLEKMGIEVVTGVPDSTLKQFCDGVQMYNGALKHYCTANEGAAVGLATGTYLSSGKPACVYLQNSGIGNTINPIASIANEDVYGIPMLFIVGWRGEPGTKDEPQHVFQGKITCELYELMNIPYSVVDQNTTLEELDEILCAAQKQFEIKKQYAIIVKKGTFEPGAKFVWNNEAILNREDVLAMLLDMVPQETPIVSTTGKISRELYEQCELIRGNHDSLFMTVGGMGHAAMIAYGIAQDRPTEKVVCIDGDGAVLMHMGALAFVGGSKLDNYIHIVINNQAHESVGSMPTGCKEANFAEIARASGYAHVERITTKEQLGELKKCIMERKGPALYEIMVTLSSRADLGRPKESARDNRDVFMQFLNK